MLKVKVFTNARILFLKKIIVSNKLSTLSVIIVCIVKEITSRISLIIIFFIMCDYYVICYYPDMGNKSCVVHKSWIHPIKENFNFNNMEYIYFTNNMGAVTETGMLEGLKSLDYQKKIPGNYYPAVIIGAFSKRF